MGASVTKKAVKPDLSLAQIDYLKARTRMSDEEILKWYSKSPSSSFSSSSSLQMVSTKIVQMVY